MTQQQLRRQLTDPGVDPIAAEPGLEAPAVQRPVRVVAGADVQEMVLAGRRVGDIRTVARTLFAVHPNAVALVDGQRVDEETIVRAGQTIEFVKYAGQKGAARAGEAMGDGLAVELRGGDVVWRRNGHVLGQGSVRQMTDGILRRGPSRDRWVVTPPNVRLHVARGPATAVVVEMPPGPRAVRWIDDDSPADCGPATHCGEYRLAFPWIVLVVVFLGGELTGVQQAFYRTEPLRSLEDELCFTNLLNVARGYDLDSWLCLANLERRMRRLPLDRRVHAITEHFWHAAFTRSSEVHEGNSHWSTGAVDPRLRSPATWAAATAADPYFVLGIRWRPTPHRLGDTVASMLERVAAWRPIETAEQVATLLQAEAD